MTSPFRSSRLLYRAWEWPLDEAYIAQRQLDTAGQANTSPFLLKPGSKAADIEGQKKWSEMALLAVVVCLPPASEGEQPTPVGDLVLFGMEPAPMLHHRNKEIGIHILPEYQGKGFGSEAIEWITDWGFRIAGLHRIAIGAFSYNKRASDLYERLGFIPEGRKRECIWYDGGWHDLVQLAMINREWKALKEKKLEELKDLI